MKIKEILEATMSIGIQGRNPISAGARGLMGARWKYSKIIDAAEPKNLIGATDRLASDLHTIEKTDYATINDLMQNISAEFVINPKDLHNSFIKKYNLTPDDFAKKQKNLKNNRPKSV